MKQLLDALNAIHPLHPECLQLITQWLKPQRYFPGSHVLKAGEICNRIAWVDSGMFRIFQGDYDKEYITWICLPGDIMISVESFFRRIPSKQYIQAVKESTTWSIAYEELEQLYRRFPEFNINGRSICQDYYCTAEQHRMIMHLPKERRYQVLLEEFPRYRNAGIPHKYLAAYLGLTPEYLSRGKKRH